MKKPLTRVTDHAMVRYFERVAGFDVDRLRREIGARVDAAAQAGATAVIIDGNHYMISEDDRGPVVTTIIHPAEGSLVPARPRRGGGRHEPDDRIPAAAPIGRVPNDHGRPALADRVAVGKRLRQVAGGALRDHAD
jgi:hypothetical protein